MITVKKDMTGMKTELIVITNMQEDQEGVTRTVVLVISKRSQGDVVLTELVTLRHTDVPLKSGGLVWKCRCIYTTMCQSIM